MDKNKSIPLRGIAELVVGIFHFRFLFCLDISIRVFVVKFSSKFESLQINKRVWSVSSFKADCCKKNKSDLLSEM